MGNEPTYSVVLGRLGRLSAALEANAEDLAHLDGVRLRLAKIVGEAEGIARQQAEWTASKQENSKQLREMLVEAQRLASGLRRFIQQNYGIRSEKLEEFGIQPFRGRKARTPQSPAAAPSATVPLQVVEFA